MSAVISKPPSLRAAAALAAALLLAGGCASPTLPNHHQFTPVVPSYPPEQPIPNRPANGAIYQADADLRLFEDRTARRRGDLVTIVLQENTTASKSANTSVDKATDTALSNPLLFGKNLSIAGYTLDTLVSGSRDFEGTGAADQSNQISGQITAVITEVYPNDTVRIQGEKTLTLNQGQEFIQVSGVVRLDDIDPNNTIASTKVADAKITYAGTGALADANAPGWLSRFFLSPYFPF